MPIASVDIYADTGASKGYIQGDRTLAVQTCFNCGCTTHYESLQENGEIMAVNFRMFSGEVVRKFRIRNFDRADTFQFLN